MKDLLHKGLHVMASFSFSHLNSHSYLEINHPFTLSVFQCLKTTTHTISLSLAFTSWDSYCSLSRTFFHASCSASLTLVSHQASLRKLPLNHVNLNLISLPQGFTASYSLINMLFIYNKLLTRIVSNMKAEAIPNSFTVSALVSVLNA